MKPHPRPPYIRKTIKWGGAALTALLVVVWIGSGWWHVGYDFSRGLCISVGSGAIFFEWWTGPNQLGDSIAYFPGWHVDERSGTYFRLPRVFHNGGFGHFIVPLWIPAIVLLPLTALAFRLDTLARRRARMNLCPKCHYDRTGLAGDAVCPECGTGK